MENFYTFVIESSSNLNWYIGHSSNITRRLEEHNSRQNKSTKSKESWRLIFLRSFNNNLEANRFKLNLKKLKNKKFIKDEYSEFFLNK